MFQKFLFFFIIYFQLVFTQNSYELVEYKFAQNLYENKNLELALEQFKIFTNKYPTSAQISEAKFYIADITFQLNRFEEAKFLFQEFVSLYPNHLHSIDALWKAGECYENLNNFKDAANSFERFRILFPENEVTPNALFRASENFKIILDTTNQKRVLKIIFKQYSSSKFFFGAKLSYIKILIDEKNFSLAESELKNLINNFPETNSETYFYLGKIAEKKFFILEAEKKYREVIEKYPNSKGKRESIFSLANIEKKKENYREAISFFSQLENEKNNFGKISLMEIANCYFDVQDFSSAKNYFDLLFANFSDYPKSTYLNAAKVEVKLNNFSSAKNYFEKAISSTNDSIRSIAVFDYGNFLTNQSEFLSAIKLYEQLENNELFLFNVGKIYFQNLKNYTKTNYIFENFILDFPKSILIDDAYFYNAASYDSLKIYDKALLNYKYLVDNFSTSEFKEIAIKRIFYIENFLQKTQSGFEKIALLLGDEKNAQFNFELGKIYFYDLKNYSSALKQFQIAIVKDSVTQIEEKEFLKLKCFEFFFYENKISLNSFENDFKNFIQKFSTDKTNEIIISIAKIYANDVQIQKAISILENATSKNEEIIFLLALYNEKLNSTQSFQLYNTIRTDFKNSKFYDDAIYRIYLLYFQNGKKDSAIAIWKENQFLNKKFSESNVQELLQYLIEKNQFEDFQFHSFYYSNFKFQIDSLYVEYLVSFKKYNEAKNFIEQNGSQKFQYQLAKIYFELGKFDLSKKNCFEILNKDLISENAKKTFYLLSTIENKLKNKSNYVQYLKCANEIKGKLVADKNIAELLFETEEYSDAIKIYEELLVNVNFEDKKLFEERIIISQLRLENLLIAKTLIDKFKREYDDKKSISKINIELGKYFFFKRNYVTASEIFDSLSSNEELEIKIEAVYWQAKILELNEQISLAKEKYMYVVENASDSLYVLPRAEFSLGNIFFNEENYHDAIVHYQNVISKGEIADDILHLAMSNLIEAFQLLKFYDAALKSTKDFINIFPNDGTIFEKKLNVGVLYTRLGLYEEAIQSYEKLLEESSKENESEIRYSIGETYFYQKNYEKAILEFLKVPYLGNKNSKIDWSSTAYYMAGQSYEQLSKFGDAIKMYQMIVDSPMIDPNFKLAAKKEIERVKKIK